MYKIKQKINLIKFDLKKIKKSKKIYDNRIKYSILKK